ncbi:MAG TPA: Hsp20/alpha crystallin family protein [Candidatus Eisenbacteria bacterium]|jgi:HSP20 family protein
MAITRWTPVTLTPARELFGIQDEVNRLFDGFFNRTPFQGDLAATFTPAVDVEETADEYVVRVDLPGMTQKDVKVNLMGDTLTIRGERKQESDRKDGNMHRIERVYGSFERSFRLGTPVRGDQVKAQYRDGVLEVQVPKAEEAKVREIEVQVGS